MLIAEEVRQLDRLTFGTFAGAPASTGTGARLAKGHGYGAELQDFRRYQPGDDPRSIDWTIHARLRQLVVRVFRAEAHLRIHLLVDRSGSMSVGTPTKLSCAARIAAEIAHRREARLERRARRDHAGVIRTLEARVASPKPADAENGVHARLAVDLAVAYTATGNRARAIQVMEAARARTPGDNDVLFDLGAAYERAGQFEAAEASFREVIGADPVHAGALNYLGYMLTERGQKLDEALTLVERAVAIEPDNPSYLDSLAWVLFKLGRATAAREPIARAAAARPQASVVQEHAGDIYFELKQYRAAADAFDRALQGDRQDIDAAAVTTKRDRARALAGG